MLGCVPEAAIGESTSPFSALRAAHSYSYADAKKAAQAWADADPYVAAGVYGKVTVKPFKKVLPA